MRITIILSLALIATQAFAASDRHEGSCMWNTDVPPVVDAARFVIFGEIHGTNEIPATVGEFVCWKSARTSKVVLGLEIPDAEQGAIDRYLSSAGAPGDRKRLIAGAFWNTGPRDGRSSKAMAGLIERVRQLRHAGRGVAVLAFDSGGDLASRDGSMAATLRGFIREHPDSTLVVLVGNNHAARADEPAARPMHMVSHLDAEHPLTIDVEALPGTAWACVPTGCGIQKMGGWRKASTAPGFHMGTSGMPGFDGSFALGAITASRPAVD